MERLRWMGRREKAPMHNGEDPSIYDYYEDLIPPLETYIGPIEWVERPPNFQPPTELTKAEREDIAAVDAAMQAKVDPDSPPVVSRPPWNIRR
jgi:hypothetical protein